MDVAGARRFVSGGIVADIQEHQALGQPFGGRKHDGVSLARADIFNDLDGDEETDVRVRPVLRQWLDHHNRTAWAWPESVIAPEMNGGGAGALSQRIAEQRQLRGLPPELDQSSRSTGATTGSAPATQKTEQTTQRSRDPHRQAATVVVSVLLSIVAALLTTLAVQKANSDTLGRGSGHPAAPQVSRSAPAPEPVRLSGLASYNPYGTGPEHTADAPRATDGSPATYWTTETYYNNGFQKPGTGLVLETAITARLTRLTIQTGTPGFQAQIRVSDRPDGGFRTDSSWHTVSTRTSFNLRGLTGRYWLIWLRLPTHQGVAHINEVQATS
jgi:hypothetical protein